MTGNSMPEASGSRVPLRRDGPREGCQVGRIGGLALPDDQHAPARGLPERHVGGRRGLCSRRISRSRSQDGSLGCGSADRRDRDAGARCSHARTRRSGGLETPDPAERSPHAGAAGSAGPSRAGTGARAVPVWCPGFGSGPFGPTVCSGVSGSMLLGRFPVARSPGVRSAGVRGSDVRSPVIPSPVVPSDIMRHTIAATPHVAPAHVRRHVSRVTVSRLPVAPLGNPC